MDFAAIAESKLRANGADQQVAEAPLALFSADTKELQSPLLESRNLIEIKNLRLAGFDSTPAGWF